METRTRWVKKYLIPNNKLTIILTKYMSLIRLRTRPRCVKKYLLPDNMLTIPNTTLTSIVTLTRTGTMAQWVKKPNTIRSYYHIDIHVDPQKTVDGQKPST